MKLANALNKLRDSYRLVIKDPACSNHIDQQPNRRHQSCVPAIVSLMAPVHAPTVKKNIPLALIHPFNKQIVPSLYP